MIEITQSYLQERFIYDAFYGALVERSTGRYAGTMAKSGYRMISIGGKMQLHHRMVAIYSGFSVSGKSIDHINGNRSDNRIENLRVVNKIENSRNQRPKPSNVSGFTGVSWDKVNNKWRATIKVKYKQINIGRFSELSDAIDARKSANLKYGFHENHGIKFNA